MEKSPKTVLFIYCYYQQKWVKVNTQPEEGYEFGEDAQEALEELLWEYPTKEYTIISVTKML